MHACCRDFLGRSERNVHGIELAHCSMRVDARAFPPSGSTTSAVSHRATAGTASRRRAAAERPLVAVRPARPLPAGDRGPSDARGVGRHATSNDSVRKPHRFSEGEQSSLGIAGCRQRGAMTCAPAECQPLHLGREVVAGRVRHWISRGRFVRAARCRCVLRSNRVAPCGNRVRCNATRSRRM